MTRGHAIPDPPPRRAARPLRTALGILFKATIIFIVSMFLWKPLAPAVATVFRGASNITAAGVYRGAIQISYTPGAIGKRDADTIIRYKNLQERVESEIQSSSWYYAFVPMALLGACVLATPIAWKRRGRAALLGALVLTVLTVLGQMIIVYDKLTGVPIDSPIQVGPVWNRFIATIASIFAELPGSYFIPIIVYALVTFRRQELVTLFGASEANASS